MKCLLSNSSSASHRTNRRSTDTALSETQLTSLSLLSVRVRSFFKSHRFLRKSKTKQSSFLSCRCAALQSAGPRELCVIPVPVQWRVLLSRCLSGSSILRISASFLAAQMYRAPLRPQRSPGAPRPTGRFPSPVSCWGLPGARSPYGGSGYRGGSPRGCPAYSPRSNRGYWDGSPAGFGSGSRGFGGQMRHRGDGFRRPQSFSPGSAQKASDASVEKYFSPSMLQDPWAALQPQADTQHDGKQEATTDAGRHTT